MPSYIYKDETEIAFAANRKLLRAQGAVILDRMMNEALKEMSDEFNKGIAEGRILRLEATSDDIIKYLQKAVHKQLEK